MIKLSILNRNIFQNKYSYITKRKFITHTSCNTKSFERKVNIFSLTAVIRDTIYIQRYFSGLKAPASGRIYLRY